MTGPDRVVMVCHDCCCGTIGKHPDVDHEAQRTALRACASDAVRVRTVECLDECDRSNVVLVRDLTLPRRQRDTWLGDLLDPAAIEVLAGWIEQGGPLPPYLLPHRFPRRDPAPGES